MIAIQLFLDCCVLQSSYIFLLWMSSGRLVAPSRMIGTQHLRATGKELDLKEEDLRMFVKAEQDAAREERAAVRAAESIAAIREAESAAAIRDAE